ncbi:hypothetical protein GCM10027187_64620 [Streptosporangium sandarakinum]
MPHQAGQTSDDHSAPAADRARWPGREAKLTFTVETGAFGTPMAVVHVHGPLDYGTSVRLETGIERLWERVSGGYLVLDLRQVTFCDSTGLSRLITAFTDAQRRQVALLLAALPPFLCRTLELTGLTPFLPIRDSLAQALAEAKAHSGHTGGQQPPV